MITSLSSAAPYGACKFLRGNWEVLDWLKSLLLTLDPTRFAPVHKVFGASNVYKLLLHIPVNRRHDSVVTISYQVQARLSNPVYAYVSTILALQQHVFLFGLFIHLGGTAFLFVSQELNFHIMLNKKFWTNVTKLQQQVYFWFIYCGWLSVCLSRIKLLLHHIITNICDRI